MKSENIRINLIDAYLMLINNLSQDEKQTLISKLSKSIKVKSKEVTIENLFGAFKSDKTAEEQIEEIYQSRVFNRKNELF